MEGPGCGRAEIEPEAGGGRVVLEGGGGGGGGILVFPGGGAVVGALGGAAGWKATGAFTRVGATVVGADSFETAASLLSSNIEAVAFRLVASTSALGFEAFVLRFLRVTLCFAVSWSSVTALATSEAVGAVALFLPAATRALRRVVVVVAGTSTLTFVTAGSGGIFSIS